MRDSIDMSKKIYYSIVGLCATIIMANSIETFLKVKDNGMFELWFSNPNLATEIVGKSSSEAYSIYLTMCLSIFFIRVIAPVALAINTYFAFVKLRVSKLFVQIWVVLLIGLFAFTTVGETFYSIFFIIGSIAYLGLVIIMICQWKEINRKMNEQVIESIQKV